MSGFRLLFLLFLSVPNSFCLTPGHEENQELNEETRSPKDVTDLTELITDVPPETSRAELPMESELPSSATEEMSPSYNARHFYIPRPLIPRPNPRPNPAPVMASTAAIPEASEVLEQKAEEIRPNPETNKSTTPTQTEIIHENTDIAETTVIDEEPNPEAVVPSLSPDVVSSTKPNLESDLTSTQQIFESTPPPPSLPLLSLATEPIFTENKQISSTPVEIHTNPNQRALFRGRFWSPRDIHSVQRPKIVHFTRAMNPGPSPFTPKSIMSAPPQYGPLMTTHKPVKSNPIKPKSIPSAIDINCDLGDNYYPAKDECEAFIECKRNVAIKYQCPDGLYFNPEIKYPDYPCAYPSEVQCVSRIKHTPISSGPCPRQYGFFASEDDCTKYFMCQEGRAIPMKCPTGLAFNTITNSCDWPANVPSCNPEVFQGFTCPPAPLDEDGSPSDIIANYRYEKRCKEYVACQRGKPRLLSCDGDYAFDSELGRCVPQELANCSM